jgi:hypothetical protein
MRKITHVNVEHNGQSWFGTKIEGVDANDTLDAALAYIRVEARTSPGDVTRVEFTHEGDEE